MELWDRQKGETKKAFTAFAVYRGMNPLDRSISKVAESFPSSTSKTGHRNRSLMAEWSRKYNWVARVDAFDAEMERQGLAVQEQAARDMYERYAKTGFDLFRKIAQRVEGDDENNIKAIDPSILSAADLRTLGELAIKFETLRHHEEREKADTNRPIVVKLAFDGTPRFPDDRGDTPIPAAPRELPPAA